jgi:hypothetical protein
MLDLALRSLSGHRLALQQLVSPLRLHHRVPIVGQFGILRPDPTGGHLLKLRNVKAHLVTNLTNVFETVMQSLERGLVPLKFGLPSCPLPRQSQQPGLLSLHPLYPCLLLLY